MAIALFNLTFFVIWHYLARGDILLAYILNGVIILLITIKVKMKLNYLHNRTSAPCKNKRLSIFLDYFILEKQNLNSVKTSLYLLYIFVLVSSHILRINPYLFELSENTRNYFSTIGYGLILLIAVDKFVNQFMKDNKRIKTYKDIQKEN